MSASTITISLGLFLLAGFFEIAGGWLVWQWLKEARPWPWGLLGGKDSFSLRRNPDFPASALRSASMRHTVGFLLSCLFCGVGLVDGNKPDQLDLIGGAVSLVRVAIMMYWPR